MSVRWLLGLALGWGAIAWGFWFLGTAVVDRVEALGSENWRTTIGTVVEISVEEKETGGRRSNRSTQYRPVVRYEYRVDGETHYGDRIGLGSGTYASYSDASKVINRYPTGSEVLVYYDPDSPGRSALETGLSWRHTFVDWSVGLGLIGGGWLFLRLQRAFGYRPPAADDAATPRRRRRRMQAISRRARRRSGALDAAGEGG